MRYTSLNHPLHVPIKTSSNPGRRFSFCLPRHCEPTGRANARPMTGSAKQSSFSSAERKLDCFVACAPRNDGERARTAATDLPVGQISSVVALAPRHYFVEPDQCDLGRPVPFEKIFRFPFDPNHF